MSRPLQGAVVDFLKLYPLAEKRLSKSAGLSSTGKSRSNSCPLTAVCIEGPIL